MNWVISMKKSIMFIFVMLFMFCVGCLGVKANCQYYDENNELMVEFDYIPVGTALVSGSRVNVNLNLEIYYEFPNYDRVRTDYMESGVNFTIGSNNFCPDYVVLYAEDFNDGGSAYQDTYNRRLVLGGSIDFENPEYAKVFTRLGREIKHLTDQAVYSSEYAFVSIAANVNSSAMGRVVFTLNTYSDNTYELCVSSSLYSGGFGGSWGTPTEVCEEFSSLSSIPTISVNDRQFTVSSEVAALLYSTDTSNMVSATAVGATIYRSESVYVLGTTSSYNNSGTNQGPQDFEGNLGVTPVTFCEEEGVQKTFQVIGYLLFVAKIIIPLILIILGSIDFAKATISSDEKAPKDAIMALARRIIIAIIIFLIPTILNFLLSLVNGASEAFNDSNFTDCTNCLFDPFGDCDI